MKRALRLVAFAATLPLVGCMTQIPPSSVGIKFNGVTGVSERLLKPEMVMRGFNDQIIIYPTSIRNATYVKNAQEGDRTGDDAMRATTSEGAKLPVDITVAYHVEPSDAVRAFRAFGTEDLRYVQATFVRTSTMYGVDLVAGSRSIFALTSKERSTFGAEVRKVIAPILREYGITVDDVAVGEVHPDGEIQERINESVSLRAELDTKKTELEKAKIDARTAETNARKTAELNQLLASQSGEEAIAVKKLEIRRKAIAKWKAAGGRPPMVGDGRVPFTAIDFR